MEERREQGFCTFRPVRVVDGAARLPTRLAPPVATRDAAVVKEPSHVVQLCNGDQRTSGRPWRPSIEPEGSKTKH